MASPARNAGFLALLAFGFALTGGIGCNHDSGLNPTQEKTANRLDEIVKKSGGDWEKLSESDRDFLIKEVAHGNEQSARTLLTVKSRKLPTGPPAGGPSVGGPPGGVPPTGGPGR